VTAYNGNVIRFAVILLAFNLLLTFGCKRAGDNKQAVHDSVVQHLAKNAALDVNQLDIDVTDVKFNGNEAVAAVSIKPKSAPQQGMNMTYTLERRGEKWEVKGRGAGHAGMGAGSGPMGGPPAGAVPEAGAAESGSHAATPEPKGALGDAPGSGGTAGGALPPGHPPVTAPAPSGAK